MRTECLVKQKTTLNVVETVRQHNFGKDQICSFQKYVQETNQMIYTKLQNKSVVHSDAKKGVSSVF